MSVTTVPGDLTPDKRYEITPEQALDIARGWVELLSDNDLEVLASEQPIINDDLRLAGTLDRIVRLSKDLAFGETVIPAGTVLVLDIKTSKLHADDDGVPSYWDSYPIQIAAYASAQPYDTEAEQRLTWEEVLA